MPGWKLNYFFSWLTSLVINRFRDPASQRFYNILVIRLDEIGDMVTSLPVFDRLREKFPGATITAWTIPLTAPLLAECPSVDEVVTTMPGSGRRFDLIVDLRGSFATMRYALAQRPAYRLDRGSVRFRNKLFSSRHPHEVYTNLQVIEPVTGKTTSTPKLRLSVGEANRNTATAFLKEQEIGPFVIFHAGARKPLRRWPAGRFAELGAALHTQRNLDVVFAGTPDERDAIADIQKAMPFRTHVFCGYSLLDLAALASRATLFVGNESGPMHLAAAMDIPVVGLFGPGEPHVFAPFGEKSVYLHHKLECNPCGQVVCKYPGNTCMNRITTGETLNKIAGLLD